jgi:hypothetical protein
MTGSISTPINALDYRDEIWLRNAYLTKNLTMSSIAAACGVSPMTIQNWLDRYGIPTRPRGRTVSSAHPAHQPRNRTHYIKITKQEYDALKSDRARLLIKDPQGLEDNSKENLV